MPITTPLQKVNKVRLFGKEFVEIEFIGDTYDEAYNASLVYKAEKGAYYVHPFNDKSGMIGQGTVGLEILEEIKVPIDMLFYQ
jgi:L-threonine ammonia-lyase (EC 4.3.1.19)